MSIATIKAKVKAHLDNLVTAQALASYVTPEKPKEFDQLNIQSYPCAILWPSTETSSTPETNRDLIRVHTYDIAIIQKGENITSDSYLETLTETIVTEFDNDPTMGGSAGGGVPPAVSNAAIFGSADQSFVVFVVTIQPHELVALTY